MKKIKFLRGYRGVLTAEMHYKSLTVVEFSNAQADALVARGIAEYYDEKVTPKKKPVKRKPAAKKKAPVKRKTAPKIPTGKISTTRGKK